MDKPLGPPTAPGRPFITDLDMAGVRRSSIQEEEALTGRLHPEMRQRRGSIFDFEKEDDEADHVEEDSSDGSGSYDDIDGVEHGDHADGLIWHAQVVPDDYANPKHVDSDGNLYLRRPIPQIRATDFFGKLVRTDDGAYIFPGQLNGWPALDGGLQLLSITCRVKRRIAPGHRIRRYWSATKSKTEPQYPAGIRQVRATLRQPSWSAHGWAPESPRFVFWAAAQTDAALKVHHGTEMMRNAQLSQWTTLAAYDPNTTRATRAHMFAHRYGKAKESAKDRLTYHCGVLLEWDHGQFCTLVELAWFNGLGGYRGKSNWYRDIDSECPALFAAMPASMKAPWMQDRAELRAFDLPLRDVTEFEAYLKEFTGPTSRFLDPHIVHSNDVRLTHRSQVDVMQYLCNYIGRSYVYSEEGRNCQTFAADFYGFMAGKKGIQPYSQVCRVFYKNVGHTFLYDPDQYA